jgi:hypothetical protein
MMKKIECTLLFLLFASCFVHAAGPDTLVGAYYYPWHTGSSFHGGNPPGSTTLVYHLNPQVTPALGWYNQYNSSVISQHYNWARYAGIDFFVCSYWGMGTNTDSVIRNYMFNNPDRGDIKLCVFMEPSITPASGAPGATEAEITAETNYLCDNYFNRTGYFRIDGKPVIFIYVTRSMTDADLTLCISAIRTAAINKGTGQVYIVGDEVWGSPNIAVKTPRVSQMDAVTNYDVYGNLGSASFVTDSKLNTWQSNNNSWKSFTDGLGKKFIPAISPGFNDRCVRLDANHTACSRKLNNETNAFGTLFSGMLDRVSANMDMLMITSWNEWHEDTQIEPTIVAAPTNIDDSVTGDTYTQGHYYEGYGIRYLDILREQFVSVEIPIGASARGENPPNETADKAFDGNKLTKWLDFSPTGSWIQYRYADGQTKTVTKYTITSANDSPARDPKDWNLLGSRDGGITWDILDSRTGIIFLNRFETKIFFVSNPDDYNSYRLQITAVKDAAAANSVQLAEIQLLSCFGLADFDCDGKVDISDFSYMAGVWLTNDPTADIAEPAGQVDVQDLLVLIQEWLSDSLVDGAVAYWKLDETTGSAASDYSVNAHHGTLMNMDNSDWVAGKLGNALDFDGVNDYVEIQGYKGVTGTASRTCAAWIKTDKASSQILNWGTLLTGQKWIVRINENGTLRAEVQDGYIYGTRVLTDNQWHHIAVALYDDGSPNISEARLYVDGQLETTGGILACAVNTAAVQDVQLGVFTVSPLYFRGLIDDVRIYDRALSAAEIAKVSQ